MKTIITAIDKAVREGVYTLEEISIIMKEIDGLAQIVQAHAAAQEAAKEEKVLTPKKGK